MKKLCLLLLLICLSLNLSACFPGGIQAVGAVVDVITGGEKTEEAENQGLSKRYWDPGKKKYYRYDQNGERVYE